VNILVIIKAIGDVVGAVKSIYDFVKFVQEFFSEPTDVNRDRYLSTYARLLSTRNELFQLSGSILSAIQALEVRIFREVLADKLGDSDQAMQDLDAWHRNTSDALRGLALDRSAGAVADMLQYVRGGVYPRPAMVFALGQVLSVRLIVLRELDPGFCTSKQARQPVEDGIAVIRDAAAEIDGAVFRGNAIVVQRFVRKQRDDDPLIGATVTYSNVSGTASFERTVGPFGILDPALEAGIEQAREAAESVRQRGLAEDRERAQVPALREMAAKLEESLRLCEFDAVSQTLQLPLAGLARARFVMLRQDRTLSESLQAVLSDAVGATDEGRSLDVARAGRQLLTRPPTEEELAAFGHVADSLGTAMLAKLLLNHPDSVFT
jgi:hypothetical protein